MDLSNIFLYIAIGSVIVSILWLIYIFIDVKREREVRRKKQRDEKVKVKVDDLNDEAADFIQVNMEKGTQIITVKMPEMGVVAAEQILAAMVVPRVNASTSSPKIRHAHFKTREGYKKTIGNSKRGTHHIILKKDELA